MGGHWICFISEEGYTKYLGDGVDIKNNFSFFPRCNIIHNSGGSIGNTLACDNGLWKITTNMGSRGIKRIISKKRPPPSSDNCWQVPTLLISAGYLFVSDEKSKHNQTILPFFLIYNFSTTLVIRLRWNR